MNLSWDPKVLDVLADGYNIRYGARSIRDEVRCELPSGGCVPLGTAPVPFCYVFFPSPKSINVGDLKFLEPISFLLFCSNFEFWPVYVSIFHRFAGGQTSCQSISCCA